METDLLSSIDWMMHAQRGRATAGGIVLLFTLIQWFAGLAAILGGALLWISEKTEEALTWASIAAFGGGAWSGYTWFGWPFVESKSEVMTSPGGFFSQPVYETVTETSFSIIALLGNGVFGVIGFFTMCFIVGIIEPALVENQDDNAVSGASNNDNKKSS